MIGSYDGWCVCYPGSGEMVRLRECEDEGVRERITASGSWSAPEAVIQLTNSPTH